MKTSCQDLFFTFRRSTVLRFFGARSMAPTRHPADVKQTTLETASPSSRPLTKNPTRSNRIIRLSAERRASIARLSLHSETAAAPAPAAAKKLIAELQYPRADREAAPDAKSAPAQKSRMTAQTIHALIARGRKRRSKDLDFDSDKKTPPAI